MTIQMCAIQHAIAHHARRLAIVLVMTASGCSVTFSPSFTPQESPSKEETVTAVLPPDKAAVAEVRAKHNSVSSSQTSSAGKVPATKKPATGLDLKGVRTAAIVDLSKTPMGGLFEAKLLGSRQLTWIERAQIDKVTRELELQTLFSPQGGAKRAGLGKLLKADVLIMVRALEAANENKSNVLQIIVCESKRGLRLTAETVPLTGRSEVDIDKLESIVDAALVRLTEKTTEICAVPPFLSHDLDYRYDYLKAALARAVEQHLLQRKGVLLVELAEAQALAKENFLAGDDASIERRLPLFFLGSFRHDGESEKRKVTVSLAVRRGDKELANQQNESVVPAEVVKSLKKMVDGFAAKSLVAADPALIDTKAEMRQLVERATAHQILGNWQEALDLFEAALLLDPADRKVHSEAVIACSRLIEQMSQQVRKNHDLAMPMMHVFRRGMEHMEFSAQPIMKMAKPIEPNIGPMPSENPYNWLVTYSHIPNLYNLLPRTKERNALLIEVLTESQQIMVRLCRARTLAGTGDEHRFLEGALGYTSNKKIYSLTNELIHEFKDLPHARKRTYYFARSAHGNSNRNPADFEPFIQGLAAHSHPDIRAGALDLLKDLGRDAAATKKQLTPPDTAKQFGASGVRFEPVMLHYGKVKSTGEPAILSLKRCVPLAGKTDLMVSNQALFLMKEKGVLTLAMKGATSAHCYDGRYVWFTIAIPLTTPRVFVLDPGTEKIVEVLGSDGLPTPSREDLPERQTVQRIELTPLGPGKVLMAGYFGKSWLGIGTFDSREGRKTVKIFHEAREDARALRKDQWTSSSVTFEPQGMFIVGSETGARRVLIVRGSEDFEVQSHPLVVDPDKLTVEVMKNKVGSRLLVLGQVHENALYFTGDGNKLIRMPFPAQEKQYVMEGIPHGPLVITGDEMYLISEKGELWYGSLSKKQVQRIGVRPNGNGHYFGPSNHYGMLITNWSPEEGYKIHQVLVSPKIKIGRQ